MVGQCMEYNEPDEPLGPALIAARKAWEEESCEVESTVLDQQEDCDQSSVTSAAGDFGQEEARPAEGPAVEPSSERGLAGGTADPPGVRERGQSHEDSRGVHAGDDLADATAAANTDVGEPTSGAREGRDADEDGGPRKRRRWTRRGW